MKYEIINASRAADKSVAVGDIVYEAGGYDYGLANDDTRFTGINHISVTYNMDGSIPYFTIPKEDVKEV